MFEEFQPDIFIGQTYNIDRGLIAAFRTNPHCRTVLTGSDWSDFSNNLDKKYPILKANTKEIKLVDQLNTERVVDLIICHYHDNSIKTTHHLWNENLGIPIHGLPLASDIADYCGGVFTPEFESDIFFIGGMWAYKGISIKEWFFPLLSSELNLNVKIFGNKPWGVNQYAGFLDTRYVKHAMKSAKVCPNISEPHSFDFGVEVNERFFKLLSNKCPCVSDYSKTMIEDFFPNGEIEFAKTPKEYKEKILAVIAGDLTIDVEKGYESVMNNHTYFHRCAELFNYLKLPTEANNILLTYQKIRKENNL